MRPMRRLIFWALMSMSSPLALGAQQEQPLTPVPHALRGAALAPDEIVRQGAEVYQAHCAVCHEQPDGRVPNRTALAIPRSADYIVRALTSGSMAQQGSALSADEKNAVASFLAGRMPGGASEVDINANRCRHAAPPMNLDEPAWNGWDARGTSNLRYQPEPGLTAAQVPRLKLKWAFAYPGGASTQATIVGGRVFVPSMGGVVFSLDPDSGCTYWAADMGASVRTAVSVGRLPSGAFVAYLGDYRGYVHALDADTGKELWRTQVDDHTAARVAGAPVLFEGRLFVPVSSLEEARAVAPEYRCCTFRGSLVALDAATGRMLWKSFTIAQEPGPLPGKSGHVGPAGAAVWSAPTIDVKRRIAYVATGNAYTAPAAPETDAVVAFDLDTGARRWVRQVTPDDAWLIGCDSNPHRNCPAGKLGPDHDLGASPILARAPGGKDVLIVSSKAGKVWGLDVDHQGRLLWEAKGVGGITWGSASDGERVYVPLTARGRASPAEAKGNRLKPGLNALSAATGALLWHTPAPEPQCTWGTGDCSARMSSAPIVIPGVVFAGSFDGHERAYSTADGKVLWEGDTGMTLAGVNGGEAMGGAIDHGGQTIAGGRLFVSSGARNGHAGNSLLVFTVDGK